MVNRGAYAILLHIIIVVSTVVHADDNDDEEFLRLIGRCSRRAPDFDRCMRDLFNDLRVYFPTGKKEINCWLITYFRHKKLFALVLAV